MRYLALKRLYQIQMHVEYTQQHCLIRRIRICIVDPIQRKVNSHMQETLLKTPENASLNLHFSQPNMCMHACGTRGSTDRTWSIHVVASHCSRNEKSGGNTSNVASAFLQMFRSSPTLPACALGPPQPTPQIAPFYNPPPSSCPAPCKPVTNVNWLQFAPQHVLHGHACCALELQLSPSMPACSRTCILHP